MDPQCRAIRSSLPKPQSLVIDPNVQVTFLDDELLVEIGWRLNFRELGALLFQLQQRLMMQIRVEHFSVHPRPTDTVLDFLAQEKDYLCSIKGVERVGADVIIERPMVVLQLSVKFHACPMGHSILRTSCSRKPSKRSRTLIVLRLSLAVLVSFGLGLRLIELCPVLEP